MNCDEIRELTPDRLDALLDDERARAVDDHIASCAGCSAERASYGRFRAALYAPYPVPAHAPAAHRRGGAGAGLVRYAAAFAAGVLLTLVVQSARAAAPPPPPDRPVAEPVSETPPPVLVPRRIA